MTSSSSKTSTAYARKKTTKLSLSSQTGDDDMKVEMEKANGKDAAEQADGCPGMNTVRNERRMVEIVPPAPRRSSRKRKSLSSSFINQSDTDNKQWYWLGAGARWHPYSAADSAHIEKKFQSKCKRTFALSDEYSIDVDARRQVRHRNEECWSAIVRGNELSSISASSMALSSSMTSSLHIVLPSVSTSLSAMNRMSSPSIATDLLARTVLEATRHLYVVVLGKGLPIESFPTFPAAISYAVRFFFRHYAEKIADYYKDGIDETQAGYHGMQIYQSMRAMEDLLRGLKPHCQPKKRWARLNELLKSAWDCLPGKSYDNDEDNGECDEDEEETKPDYDIEAFLSTVEDFLNDICRTHPNHLDEIWKVIEIYLKESESALRMHWRSRYCYGIIRGFDMSSNSGARYWDDALSAYRKLSVSAVEQLCHPDGWNFRSNAKDRDSENADKDESLVGVVDDENEKSDFSHCDATEKAGKKHEDSRCNPLLVTAGLTSLPCPSLPLDVSSLVLDYTRQRRFIVFYVIQSKTQTCHYDIESKVRKTAELYWRYLVKLLKPSRKDYPQSYSTRYYDSELDIAIGSESESCSEHSEEEEEESEEEKEEEGKLNAMSVSRNLMVTEMKGIQRDIRAIDSKSLSLSSLLRQILLRCQRICRGGKL